MCPLRTNPFQTDDTNVENIDMYVKGVLKKSKEKPVDLSNAEVDEELTDLVVDLSLSSKKKMSTKDFELLKVLGQGSFGKVFLVRKLGGEDGNTLYAMKVLKKATLKLRDRVRSKMERDILADIRHPFIVGLHYAFQTEGKLYLVLQFLRGGDLFTRLAKEIMFTEDDVTIYLAELALALEHLHSLGIIYRDLKPENILLDVSGHLKLTDFGLSKESVYEDDKTYSFCGTVEYMAPEVINRHGHNTAADWWSFAVLMFEMLTGTLPFHDKTRKGTMDMIMKAKLAMPTYLSTNSQNFLRCIFKRNPKNRLGFSGNGVTDLKNHEFFSKINWDDLINLRIDPPFKPAINPADDAFCFDPEFTTKLPFNSPGAPLNESEHAVFRGFSYIAPRFENNYKSNETDKNAVSISDNDLRVARNLGIKFKPFAADYELLEKIAEGSFSKVHRCKQLKNMSIYAVKIIDKGIQKNAYEEIEILLRYASLKNIVSVFDIIENDGKIYLVMEYLEGGELFDLIVSKKSYSEIDVKDVMQVVCKTVHYLHNKRVVHRDIKPSNILFLNNRMVPDDLRIIDFGFARQMRADNGLLMTPCYTSSYVAPEVLTKQGYDSAADIWSIGVILYTMLSGHSPFATNPDDSPEQIHQNIITGKLDTCSGNWQKISEDAKQLLKEMLHCNPLKRISLANILTHDWMISKPPPINERININLNSCDIMKKSVKATYKVVESKINKKTNLQPVKLSKLAMRRQNNLENIEEKES